LNAGKLQAVWVGTSGSSADLLLDITGYFTADLTGSRFHPIVPARILDTTTGKGLTAAFANRTPRQMSLVWRQQVPIDAKGVAANLTVVNPSSKGFAFISPNVVASPTSSTVNTGAGVNGANGLDVPLSGGGVALIWAGTVGSTADLQLDLTGYWK
jgi:hypothetical protein